ncbi:DUF4062 domain-containing protein [Nocardioides sp. TRM66260-LWL]|uniref:DUF4062 domain-containing protein n=1 Tax=Nocardioides sp. TRM66260-LWL TaxID=2874478 RepID=UPI001CC73A77|nr:DUF4062 domain-containing protein [Nocardioides sp. TRM66260-LWL]MBZ5733482.1 DUF4062 domain-containing protein [Nocardioides sp. TRM66260-LWL]
MHRIYTAFVSSTYLDLVEQRQLVSNQLLKHDCFPFGMELFPSTGESPWTSILEGITSADFCVFIIAGRYGSIVPGMDISWTHREFREAVKQNKPMIVLLHDKIEDLPSRWCENDPVQQQRLERFRREVEAQSGVCFFRADVGLVSGLTASIRKLQSTASITGWIPAGINPMSVQETDFTHTYDLVEAEHILSRNSTDPSKLDITYRGRRRLRSNIAEGVRSFAQDFSRSSDSLPFSNVNPPMFELTFGHRSLAGDIRLEEPRKSSGSTFVQDVYFDPPLQLGEKAEIELVGFLPRYRFASLEDTLSFGSRTPLGPLKFDFISRAIAFPTRRLILQVFLPADLNCIPVGPKTGRATSIDEAASAALAQSGHYTRWDGHLGDIPGTFMRLDLPEPRFRQYYRLCWQPPRASR